MTIRAPSARLTPRPIAMSDASPTPAAHDPQPHGSPRRPAFILLGIVALMLGAALTVTAIVGIARGQDVFMLLVIWMITGVLPLWGGWNALQKGLGHRSRGPDSAQPPAP